ncbi:DUF2813 domain-containing protein [Ectothiorhodospiraceae bacterium BW-2]|nr:DUF2813 domain-containing protein [Ectothiorhodospiraceae bacterium BW-2]
MKLSHVTLENFRAIEHLRLELGQRLTLLMGENGSGKTSIIDAISVGFGAVVTYLPNVSGISFKKTDPRIFENRIAPYTRIQIEAFNGVKWDRMVKRDQNRSTAKLLPKMIGQKHLEQFLDQTIVEPYNRRQAFRLPVIVSYGVSRALLNPPLTRKGFPKTYTRFDALAGAFQSDSRFKSAFIWFYNKEHEELRLQKKQQSFDVALPELKTVRQAIGKMFPDLSEPHIETNPLQFVINQHGQFLNIDQLSDGYKTLLGLVIDLSARMAMANPESSNPLAEESIVMIDEVDLHLHPVWQIKVVGDLLRTFPNTQFILTTHSPYIVESINNNLKRSQIAKFLDQSSQNNAIKKIEPLAGQQIKAYLIQNQQVESILDQETGLLDDKLIASWNEMNAVYEQMRDLEWGLKQ